MPSSYTASLRLNLQATGENLNTWGNINNSGVITLLDSAIAGWVSVAVPATGYTLTTANGMTDEARRAIIRTTGVGGTLTLPAVSKRYDIINACAGVLTVASAGGGLMVALDPDDRLPVFTDGVNVYGLAIGGLGLKSYIDSAVLTATGTLPATTGNEGRALIVRSGAWTPSFIETTDIADYDTNVKGLAVALAVAL